MPQINLLRDISVRAKVIAAFACTIIALLAVGAMSMTKLAAVNSRAQTVNEKYLPSMRVLGDLGYRVLRARQLQATYLLDTTEERRTSDLNTIRTIESDVGDSIREIRRLSDPGGERDLIDGWVGEWQDYVAQQEKLVSIWHNEGPAAAVVFYTGPLKRKFNTLRSDLAANISYTTEHGESETQAEQEAFQKAKTWITFALGVGVLLCLIAGAAIIFAVSRPLGTLTAKVKVLASGNLAVDIPEAARKDEVGMLASAIAKFKEQLEAAEHSKNAQEELLERAKARQTALIVDSIGAGLDALAHGDLTHRIEAELSGAFAKLKDDFNASMARLQDSMKSVLSSANGISTGAGQIAQATDDLSRRTEQQAAGLEQTAAALEQITATVTNTARNAQNASAIVGTAKAGAEAGGQVVETTVQAMGQIEQSSKRITDIIGVIDEIAFQTNMLALNAAVEAARAGDAGRGFAVVASEVRTLAQRSSNAAKEIKSLIQTSSQHVDVGVKCVAESGNALTRIAAQVVEIDALMSEMLDAARQQSTGIGGVNTAVAEMDQVTQRNAAMVEQTTAASRELARETAELGAARVVLSRRR